MWRPEGEPQQAPWALASVPLLLWTILLVGIKFFYTSKCWSDVDLGLEGGLVAIKVSDGNTKFGWGGRKGAQGCPPEKGCWLGIGLWAGGCLGITSMCPI